MTLAQIDEMLPNGFHDAEVEQFIWNFQQNSAVFDIDFWIATGDDHDREKRRRGRIELQEIAFIAIEPPDPRESDPRPYSSSLGTLQIDGSLADAKSFPQLPKLRPNLPADAEIFSFYVVNWNSFIHISAIKARLVWRDA